jgi:hypothetical protein
MMTVEVFSNDMYKHMPRKCRHIDNLTRVESFVPIDHMVSTQTTKNFDPTFRSRNYMNLPEVFYYGDDGKFYVNDGHHRILHAIYRGQKTVLCIVVKNELHELPSLNEPDVTMQNCGDA